MIYKYLFLIYNDKIKTYQVRENKLEIVKYKGDDYFTDNIENFWKWWESKSAYIEGICKVDFCIISNSKEMIAVMDEYKNYECIGKTSWNINDIENILINEKIFNSYNLVNANLDICSEHKDNLYIDIFPCEDIINIKKLKVEKNEAEVEIDNRIDCSNQGILAMYYRQKTKEIICK